MSQPVMANPIINSLSGRRNGTVFLILAMAALKRPAIFCKAEINTGL